MAFGMLAFYLFMHRMRTEFNQRDSAMTVLLGIFILWNIMGWAARNPLPIVPKVQGIAVFFGFIFMFYLASNIVITKERFRLFLSITLFMALYQFIVAINQRYNLAHWNTPLIGNYFDSSSFIDMAGESSPTMGTLGHYELFGEYGVLLSCLLVPLLSSSLTQRELHFGINRIVLTLLICLSFGVLTSSRAAVILSALMMVTYYLIFIMRIFASIDRLGRQFRIFVVVALLLPVAGAYIGLGQIEKDFSTLANKEISASSIVSGESINRKGLIDAGFQRIENESWWVGFGHGIPNSNRWAWFGVDTERQIVRVADFHSLYLSLPMLYGWIGSLAFLGIIALTTFRLFGISLKYRSRKSVLVALAVGFSLFFLIFLVDQYKISILRNLNYTMLFWIWLGLAGSVVKTIRYEKPENSPPVLSSRNLNGTRVKS
jgi:hypothetical protein